MNPTVIQTLAVYAIPVLFAITVPAAARGYLARHYGDNTAFLAGRLSFNPLRHVDPIGTIAMPLLLYFVTGGSLVFGYSKPVPVDFGALRDPRWQGLRVALAAPESNFAMALAWGILGLTLAAAGIDERFLTGMAAAGIRVNLAMAALNLVPVPPLDGGRVLAALLPQRLAPVFARVEQYGFYIVMALILTGVLTQIWMRPVVALLAKALMMVLSPLQAALSWFVS
ncbi:site-2 protease family protein [Ralstonia solanacearum]|uniref:site-2 protease family protein n=1 Tax=Ralstonia solanacearum TaxID=305 RepID=UPI0001D98651|nr:site-2 protease family protein [Ralstonia solanacearum]CBJ51598.1 putative peptidase, M50 family [Ralstonia solanacearum PSI07]